MTTTDQALDAANSMITAMRDMTQDEHQELAHLRAEVERLNAAGARAIAALGECIVERDDLKARLEKAVEESNRRDQKWMEGINETLGEKLDYTDPSGKNPASMALARWNRALRQERDDLKARNGLLKTLANGLANNYERTIMEQMVLLQKERDELRATLSAAYSALRSYQYGNSSPELAEKIADATEAALKGETK